MRVMRVGAVVLGVSLGASAAGQSQDYYGAERRYSTTQVLSLLGKAHVPPRPAQVPIANIDVHAGISTRLKCGQLDVGLNIGALQSRLSEIPNKFLADLETVTDALPMLATCYAWPSLCAELKNLNFQIDRHLGLLNDQCRAIDNVITARSLAEQTEAGGHARGHQECVYERKTALGETEAEAQDFCNRHPPPPRWGDIANAWVRDVSTTREQRVLQSVLQASGQWIAGGIGEDRYAFLSGLFGELKLSHNGKLLPVFPARPQTAEGLGQTLLRMGEELACDQASLHAVATPPEEPGVQSTAGVETRFQEQALFDVTKESIDRVLVSDLFSLDPPDRKLACNSLGRTLGKLAMQRVKERAEATLALAMQNTQVPEPARKLYQQRVDMTYRAMKAEIESGSTLPLDKITSIIARMAAVQRATRRETAAAISKGQAEMQLEFERTKCESDETCQ